MTLCYPPLVNVINHMLRFLLQPHIIKYFLTVGKNIISAPKMLNNYGAI